MYYLFRLDCDYHFVPSEAIRCSNSFDNICKIALDLLENGSLIDVAVVRITDNNDSRNGDVIRFTVGMTDSKKKFL